MAEIIDQNIGTATAYGYAKNKGYEGTEDQFAQDMANVGTNIHEITEAINTFNNVTVPAATASVNSAGETQVASVNSAGLAQVAAVNSVGASQVSTITSTGTVVLNGIQAEGLAQVTAVSSAGAVQVATVNSAGSTQVAAVNSAGAVQVAAVNSKGQEVIASIPADYTALTEEVSDLNESLTELNDDISSIDNVLNILDLREKKTIDITQWNNIITGFDMLPDRNYTLSISLSEAVITTCYIAIKDGDGNSFFTGGIETGNASVEYNITVESIKENCALRIFYNAKALICNASIVDDKNAISELHTELNATNSTVAVLAETVQENVTSKIIHNVSTNHLDKSKCDIGEVQSDGTIGANQNNTHSDYIDVAPNTTVRMMYVNAGTNTQIYFTSAFYDENKTFIAGSYASGAGNNIAPQNAAYVRVSCANTYFDYSQIAVIFDTTVSDYVYEDYYDPYTSYTEDFLTQQTKAFLDYLQSSKDVPFSSQIAELSGNTVMRLVAPDTKRNYTITFIADITVVGTLVVGNGVNTGYLGGWIELDSTYLKVYTQASTTAVLVGTYPHGLNLTGKINVEIKAKKWKKADIIITASGTSENQGGMFEQDNVDWFGNYGFTYGNPTQGRITAQTTDGTYENCILKYYSADHMRDLWGFGDSYFDNWIQYIVDGFSNWMIDGASGRRSEDAYSSLLLGLQKRTPKKILWCMGMNDPDSNTAVNSSWFNVYKNLTNFCDSHGIELILCTIPCGAGTDIERNNYFKNEIIRASGYRYVDIANAVGGEERNSSWYAGLLEIDNTHPTALGSKVIASRFIADVPEMMDLG